jgi:hypothetical protein
MSEENVEIARRAFDAFNRTFTEGIPDLYDLLDPEVDRVPMSAILEGSAPADNRAHYIPHLRD